MQNETGSSLHHTRASWLILKVIILVALVGCGSPTSTPSTTETPPASLFGLEDNRLNFVEGRDSFNELDVAWWRKNALPWSQVEPNRGERNWQAVNQLETELEAANLAGIKTILIVRSTPPWAQAVEGTTCGPVHPAELDAFAAFLHDAVVRYSQPPFNVRYWEIWNEPDVATGLVKPDSAYGCWGDPADSFYGGGYYTDMLKSAYPQVKAANPQADVLIGGLLLDCNPQNPPEVSPGSGTLRDCTASKFLQGILENGGGPFFDGISFHAYDYYSGPGQYNNPGWNSTWNTTGPVLLAKALYLQELLSSYGYGEKYLVNTEGALLCLARREEICKSEDFEDTKANYLAQSFATAEALGLTGNIWYSLTGWRHSGLVDPARQPLPAYHAYRAATTALAGARYERVITDYPGVSGFAFLKDGTPLWIIWSKDGQPQSLHLPAQPSQIQDVFGLAQPNQQDISLTARPLYIWFDPAR